MTTEPLQCDKGLVRVPYGLVRYGYDFTPCSCSLKIRQELESVPPPVSPRRGEGLPDLHPTCGTAGLSCPRWRLCRKAGFLNESGTGICPPWYST